MPTKPGSSNRPRRTAPRKAASRSGPARPLQELAYAELSTRPLHVLVFLAPLLIVYELGSLLYLSNPSTGMVETISARRMISTFFETFGAFGLYLPGLALATVLLVWHVIRKDRWTLHLPVLPLMAMESVLWTVPLVVLVVILSLAMPQLAPALQLDQADPAAPQAALHALSTPARLTIAIGAGLYEELVFRVIAIALVHLLLVDVLGVEKKAGAVLAVIASAIAFTIYHDISTPAGGLNLPLAAFLLCAGLYFGLVYIWRGFGIVVGVHALYDVIALVLAPAVTVSS
jgi:membrane protease YdiL (CAAX protease family)